MCVNLKHPIFLRQLQCIYTWPDLNYLIGVGGGRGITNNFFYFNLLFPHLLLELFVLFIYRVSKNPCCIS